MPDYRVYAVYCLFQQNSFSLWINPYLLVLSPDERGLFSFALCALRSAAFLCHFSIECKYSHLSIDRTERAVHKVTVMLCFSFSTWLGRPWFRFGFALDSLRLLWFLLCYSFFCHAPLYQSFLLSLSPLPALSALLHLQYQIEIKSQTQNEIVAEQASCQIKKGDDGRAKKWPIPFPLPPPRLVHDVSASVRDMPHATWNWSCLQGGEGHESRITLKCSHVCQLYKRMWQLNCRACCNCDVECNCDWDGKGDGDCQLEAGKFVMSWHDVLLAVLWLW